MTSTNGQGHTRGQAVMCRLAADLPAWNDEALYRLLGACDGYVHAIANIRLKIDHINYQPINSRHVRRIKARERVIEPLRELEARLTANLRECQEAYKREAARAALSLVSGEGR